MAIADADAVFALDLPTELDEIAPRLRLIHAVGAGTDHFRSVRLPPGVVLTDSRGVAAAAIAEFALARLLFMWKGFAELDDAQRRHDWTPRRATRLTGKKVVVIGFGSIGAELATRCRCARHDGRRRPALAPSAPGGGRRAGSRSSTRRCATPTPRSCARR